MTTEKRLKSYRQWLRFGALTNGRIIVDGGALLPQNGSFMV